MFNYLLILRRLYSLRALFVASTVTLVGCSTGPRLAETGVLADCPIAPHCVSSQASHRWYAIAPIQVRGTAAQTQAALANIITAMPRSTLKTERPGYLYATFRTPNAGFTDDLELLLSDDGAVFHVRSSGRIGWFDWDVNRDRVERIRAALIDKLPYLDSLQLTEYKSCRRSLRFCTVPAVRARCRASSDKSAKQIISTFGVESAATPSRANGKSQGV